MITHTAPEFCFPDNRNGFGQFVDMFIANDPQLTVDLTEERSLVTRMFEILDKNNYIDKHFAEHKVLAVGNEAQDRGLPGHPADNIKELIASAVNCNLDPRFENYISSLSVKERTAVRNMYKDIMVLFNSQLQISTKEKVA